MNFSKMKVGVRLGIGFALMLLLLLAVALFSGLSMQKTSDATDYLIHEKLRNERLINEWGTIIEVNLQRSLAAGKTSEPELQKFFENAIAKNSSRVSELQKELSTSLTDPTAKSLYAAAVEQRGRYRKNRDLAFKAKASGDETLSKRYFDHDLTEAADAYMETITKLKKTQWQLIDAMEQGIHDRNVSARLSLSVAALAAILLAIGFGYLITRSLLRQLGGEPDYATYITGKIASGDLSIQVTTRTDDQTSLLFSIRAMRDSLAGIVRDVRSGTDSIVNASSEIAAGNLDLSLRTEQQASSLKETASSMEDLTSTVKQNDNNARQANQLALSASAGALKGAAAVSKVVDTMGAINESAKKIADIVGVIDGIAFQTNILALNAAVEAARAGEQGRGFAVVASEVRNLAQRSATAAKEIKLLIGDSIEKVEIGTTLVGQAGAAMHEIVAGIKRVTDTMREIAAASAEQSDGIAQINQAISQMDAVTQQNAARVEDGAATAESLLIQANRLSQVVSVFKTDGANTLRPPYQALIKTMPTRKAPAIKLANARRAGQFAGAPMASADVE